jgi:hypothetical protein
MFAVYAYLASMLMAVTGAAPQSIPQRLQIDEGASARAIQNPNANVANPSTSGGSFNTIIEGTPASVAASPALA